MEAASISLPERMRECSYTWDVFILGVSLFHCWAYFCIFNCGSGYDLMGKEGRKYVMIIMVWYDIQKPQHVLKNLSVAVHQARSASLMFSWNVLHSVRTITKLANKGDWLKGAAGKEIESTEKYSHCITLWLTQVPQLSDWRFDCARWFAAGICY